MRIFNARDADGKVLRQVRSSEDHAGRGGEGSVHSDLDRPELVLKVFHTPDARAHDKVRAMLLHRPDRQVDFQGAATIVQIAWPQEMLFEADGRFAGFSMRRVDFQKTVPLNAWFDRPARSNNQLSPDDRMRLYLAHNLAAVVEFVHQVGHAIIDVKPENIRAYRTGGFVCLVDCDGFLVRHGSNVFPAKVATRPYTAPEHLQGDWRPDTFAQPQDEFGLAVMIFLLLNDGRHPCDGTDNSAGVPSDRAGRLAQRRFCLDKASGLTPPPASQHQFFHDETLALFTRAFGPPARRPSASKWREHLRDLLDKRIVACSNNPAHWQYGKGCAWCELEKRNASAKPIQIPAPPAASAHKTPPAPPVLPRPPIRGAATPMPPVNALPPRPSSTAAGAAIMKSRKPAGLHVPKWVKLYGGVGLTLLAVAYLRTENDAAPPAPPPPAQTSGTGTSTSRPPSFTPTPAPAPPAAPAAFSADWSVAALNAVLRGGPSLRAKRLGELARATPLQQLQGGNDEFVNVRTSDGTSGWISREVIVSAADARRLSGVSPGQYVEQRRAERRLSEVYTQSKASQGSLEELHAQVLARSPSVFTTLDRLEAARRVDIAVDSATATWFGLAASLSYQSKNYNDAYIESWAALEGDPLSKVHAQRMSLAAHRLGKVGVLKSIAALLPHIAPKSATTWAIVGLAQAADPAVDMNQVSGSFVLVSKLTGDPSTGKALLADLKASSSDRRLIEAIDRALSEAASGFPPPASAGEFAQSSMPGAVTRGLPVPSPAPSPAPAPIAQLVGPLLRDGQSSLVLGNYAGAKVAATTALRLDPDNAEARSLLDRAREGERQEIGRIKVR